MNSKSMSNPKPTADAHIGEKLAYVPTKLHRGLGNKTGENNCFLNVTIQALWHLGPFRVALQELINIKAAKEQEDGRAGRRQSEASQNLLQAVCNLFVQYQFTSQDVLPPTELRESLGKISTQFELGKIADANEAFVAILDRIHEDCDPPCPDHGTCMAHEVFGGQTIEQTVCNECFANSEPMIRENFIFNFQALELISEAKNRRLDMSGEGAGAAKKMTAKKKLKKLATKIFGKGSSSFFNMTVVGGSSSGAGVGNGSVSSKGKDDEFNEASVFGQLLHKCMEVGQRTCPNADETGAAKTDCTGRATVHFYSLEPPLALALSVGWTQDRVEKHILSDFFSIVSYRIQLADLFQLDSADSYNGFFGLGGAGGSSAAGAAGEGRGGAGEPSYLFRGLVCYYGLHYVSIFQDNCPGEVKFLLFDDQKIRPLGKWEDVRAECLKAHYQPVLLLYELEKSAEVSLLRSKSKMSFRDALSTITASTASRIKAAATPSSLLRPLSSANLLGRSGGFGRGLGMGLGGEREKMVELDAYGGDDIYDIGATRHGERGPRSRSSTWDGNSEEAGEERRVAKVDRDGAAKEGEGRRDRGAGGTYGRGLDDESDDGSDQNEVDHHEGVRRYHMRAAKKSAGVGSGANGKEEEGEEADAKEARKRDKRRSASGTKNRVKTSDTGNDKHKNRENVLRNEEFGGGYDYLPNSIALSAQGEPSMYSPTAVQPASGISGRGHTGGRSRSSSKAPTAASDVGSLGLGADNTYPSLNVEYQTRAHLAHPDELSPTEAMLLGDCRELQSSSEGANAVTPGGGGIAGGVSGISGAGSSSRDRDAVSGAKSMYAEVQQQQLLAFEQQQQLLQPHQSSFRTSVSKASSISRPTNTYASSVPDSSGHSPVPISSPHVHPQYLQILQQQQAQLQERSAPTSGSASTSGSAGSAADSMSRGGPSIPLSSTRSKDSEESASAAYPGRSPEMERRLEREREVAQTRAMLQRIDRDQAEKNDEGIVVEASELVRMEIGERSHKNVHSEASAHQDSNGISLAISKSPVFLQQQAYLEEQRQEQLHRELQRAHEQSNPISQAHKHRHQQDSHSSHNEKHQNQEYQVDCYGAKAAGRSSHASAIPRSGGGKSVRRNRAVNMDGGDYRAGALLSTAEDPARDSHPFELAQISNGKVGVGMAGTSSRPGAGRAAHRRAGSDVTPNGSSASSRPSQSTSRSGSGDGMVDANSTFIQNRDNLHRQTQQHQPDRHPHPQLSDHPHNTNASQKPHQQQEQHRHQHHSSHFPYQSSKDEAAITNCATASVETAAHSTELRPIPSTLPPSGGMHPQQQGMSIRRNSFRVNVGSNKSVRVPVAACGDNAGVDANFGFSGSVRGGVSDSAGIFSAFDGPSGEFGMYSDGAAMTHSAVVDSGVSATSHRHHPPAVSADGGVGAHYPAGMRRTTAHGFQEIGVANENRIADEKGARIIIPVHQNPASGKHVGYRSTFGEGSHHANSNIILKSTSDTTPKATMNTVSSMPSNKNKSTGYGAYPQLKVIRATDPVLSLSSTAGGSSARTGFASVSGKGESSRPQPSKFQPVIQLWYHKPVQYTVVLPFVVVDRARFIGMNFAVDQANGHFVVESFYRKLGDKLPAELSKQISLMDAVLKVNGIPVADGRGPKFRGDPQAFLDYLHAFQSPSLQFEMLSSCKSILWFQCPNSGCNEPNQVESEENLRNNLAISLLTGGAGEMLQCKKCRRMVVANDVRPLPPSYSSF